MDFEAGDLSGWTLTRGNVNGAMPNSFLGQFGVGPSPYHQICANAFTPDGSGVNEVFKPVMEGFDEDDYTLYIFNRWGELAF